MIKIIIFFFIFPLIYSNHHLHSLPSIVIDPNDYPESDLILHNFQHQFHPTYSYRCLLQTESKYFHLDSSCQLLTRLPLKQICPLNYTLKLEIVFPQNTTIYELIIELKYKNPFQFNIKNDQSMITLPFYCNNHNEINIENKKHEMFIGNAHILLNEDQEEKLCQFEKNPYRIKLKENEFYENFLQMKPISSCSATNYLLASSNSKRNFEYFALNSSTGYLNLIRPLDYESITTWKLVIQGHDKASIPFYTYVIIDVDDINDCPPLLSWNFPLQTIEILNNTDAFNIEIAVHESKVEQNNVIIANLIASDLDTSSNIDDQIKFQLTVNSTDSLPFEIHGPFADSTFVLSTNHKLDRELQDKYIFNLILTDNGQPKLSSYYELSIYILDDNDNSPIFDRSIYYVDIQENNLINTTLIQVSANDSDLDDNGRVTYELNDINNKYVTIDSQTGIIRTKMQYDFEQIKDFTFNVTAMDHPNKGQQLKTAATVFVHIINQNDNIPKFPQSNYEFSIYENNAPNSFIGQVIASDIDNASLTYSLDNPSDEISSLFKISSSDGKIFALHPLDREQSDQYIFHVIASDGYHKSSRIQIQITTLDLNDEIPRFVFPNDHNDTLIIDRTYWHINDYICQIDVQDHDQIPNHTLLLVHRLDQLKNYDYLAEQKPLLKFDSSKFYLDDEARLFFNSTNNAILHDGVYYLAFKIIDGQNYFDEKLLKLIVVDNYERIQTIVKQYDYLGSHLNSRFSYLQYHSNTNTNINTNTNNNNNHNSYQPRHSYSSSSSLDQSNKFLVFIIITVLSIILIGITFIFISLIRRKSFQQKDLLKTQDSVSTSSVLQQQSDSSTANLFKPSTINNNDKRHKLRVSNCYEYGEISSPSSLLMLNKGSITPTSLINDNCHLLEKLNEKQLYDEQRTKPYSSWVLSTANRPDSRYSQRSSDSSTFHSLNRLSIPPQMHSTTNISHQLCSPKRHSTVTYESSTTTSTNNSNIQSSSIPSDYTVAIVSSSTNNSPHTPVSSDDGFCGSSDISDPPMHNGSNSLLSSSHPHHSYRQPYNMMKEGMMQKNQHSPSFTTLLNRFNDSTVTTHGTDTTRRVRFNLEPEGKHQQRTILPLPSSNSPDRLADHALRRFEQLYMTRDNVLDKQSVDSTVLYTNSTVV
ncbi:unnamed protein product [Rotaria socialis]|uniref:Cadherin domain-containing protein n=2 Tax=Rotaria socialis TaxID=392032 RepID=A0A817PS35_9BILA|nr:unnamed protein product [Rotaria socialis]CAF4195490.1 unnamed protein product [Rotaria socialis]